MRVCFVAEGCYPYVVGGVSSWIHSMIRSFPNIEFVILTIVADRSMRGKFVYELPENVTEVYEIYINDVDWDKRAEKGRRIKLSKSEYDAIRSLVLNQSVQWNALFDMFQHKRFSLDDLLMSRDFLEITKEYYDLRYSQIVFTDFLWTMRSIFLPLFTVMKSEIPKADIFHCVATGYSGILGCMAKYMYNCKLIVSEHGIYTREREEELIEADWVDGVYKNIWAEQFKKMSLAAYLNSDVITSLFGHARELQIELGCPAEKAIITPNGIETSRFEELTGRQPEDEGAINVGAVLRVTPIKDLKTMILAFYYAKQQCSRLKLWIMGPADEDPEYAQECFDLVNALGAKDVIFTGRINVREYLGRMDMTILTSISEGQPLTILESFAARKPVIATNVGNCRELIYGEEGDHYGNAGILTHIMDVGEISAAILTLANNPELCAQMGENGYHRVVNRYQLSQMQQRYRELYMKFAEQKDIPWSEEKFSIEEVTRHGRHRN